MSDKRFFFKKACCIVQTTEKDWKSIVIFDRFHSNTMNFYRVATFAEWISLFRIFE